MEPTLRIIRVGVEGGSGVSDGVDSAQNVVKRSMLSRPFESAPRGGHGKEKARYILQ